MPRVEGASSHSGPGSGLGTLPYAAPERSAAIEGDARADLFSLGAVLYEAMTGRRAFRGGSEAEILFSLLNEDPPHPQPSTRRIERLANLVMRLLAKEPGLRPANARLVVELLNEIDLEAVPAACARRQLPWLWVTVPTLAIGIVAGLSMWLSPPPSPTGPIAILPFHNVPEPEDHQRMGLVVSSQLVATIASDPGVSVLSTQKVLDLLASANARGSPLDPLASRAAQRAGAGTIISGNIIRVEPTPSCSRRLPMRRGKGARHGAGRRSHG